MVPIEGGTFTMGAPPEQESEVANDEGPAYQVMASNSFIGEIEVTQALWQAVMDTNPSRFKETTRPVDRVSWNDCQTFIRKLNAITNQNFRLPTEAEWEFAARGGTKSKGYTYSGSNTIGDVAWYDDNSGSRTHEVGTKAPNELGIYDMTGNVNEWCQDWDGAYSSSALTNPKGPSLGSTHVFRGGSWYSDDIFCRLTTDRLGGGPSLTSHLLGFRLAL